MTRLVELRHRTVYRYDRAVTLMPHRVRLRPAAHARVPVVRYGLHVSPGDHFCHWQQDPHGNFVARLAFPGPVEALTLDVTLVVERATVNPFDFFLEDEVKSVPFAYGGRLPEDLAPYLATHVTGESFERLVAELAPEDDPTVAYLVAFNRALAERIEYVTRLEPGIQTPEETLGLARGSCRDTAVLAMHVLRRHGLAARFVSGYLLQLAPDRGPEHPADGPATDIADLHAWVEVFLPGAGWVGIDPTSGLFAGEGHVPLAATAEPADAAPVDGSFAFAKHDDDDDDDDVQCHFEFSMSLRRIEEPKTAEVGFDPGTRDALERLGDEVDARLATAGVALTMGGEPTFVSSTDRDSPEWNTTALGPTKVEIARGLARRLRDAFGPRGFVHVGQGKWYPGESLPRWAITVGFRADGAPLLRAESRLDPWAGPFVATDADAARFARAFTEALGAPAAHLVPAYEDPIRALVEEGALPVDDATLGAALDDDEARATLRRMLARGLSRIVGYVLPIAEREGAFRTGRWTTRAPRLHLLPGDSSMGYRLPLASLPWRGRADAPLAAADPMMQGGEPPLGSSARALPVHSAPDDGSLRTAACVEVREGVLHLFLPPTESLEGFHALLDAAERAADVADVRVQLEGYLPPPDVRLHTLQVTPDPGVIEVNVHPAADTRALRAITATVYEEARRSGLTASKYRHDGRPGSSGGGHHIVLGGPTPAQSPFLCRPTLLPSLVGYVQAHPALSYVFAGQFLGPTSQHPRIDEGRMESLLELEVAQRAAAQAARAGSSPPWLVDRLLRDVLVDVTGNTHRTEICIDKLYAPDGPSGRRGLVELRGFEMMPTAEQSMLVQLLVRAIVLRLVERPHDAPPVPFGHALLDRYLLPHFLEGDLHDVLDDLARHGLRFEPGWFEAHLERRFPQLGTVRDDDATLTLRTALEPWHVLGEDGTPAGTVRYVDSTVERVEVRLEGVRPDRAAVLCNGRPVPMVATRVPGRYVGGVRFRAHTLPRSLHPAHGLDAPLVFEWVDTTHDVVRRSCTYHAAHPDGRAFELRPVNAIEAESRRVARFLPHGGLAHATRPSQALRASREHPLPTTLDLVRTAP